MSDIEKENYEDFLNFEKRWDEWRLREEIPLETFVASGYFCVEEFYNFSKKYFGEKLEQENKDLRLVIERGDAIKDEWDNKHYQEAVHYNYLDDKNHELQQLVFNQENELNLIKQENKMMRECLEIIKEEKYEATPWLTVETGSAKRAKECLNKLTKDER